MEKAICYCYLYMIGRFWVVHITERAWVISAFTTPSGLLEWSWMHFGLKNALKGLPALYRQRFVQISENQCRSWIDHGWIVKAGWLVYHRQTLNRHETKIYKSKIIYRRYINIRHTLDLLIWKSGANFWFMWQIKLSLDFLNDSGTS